MMSNTTSVETTTSGAGVKACGYCGLIHLGTGLCPSIKAIEYHPDGSVKRVEMTTPADYLQPAGIPWSWSPYSAAFVFWPGLGPIYGATD